jgi:hypothetical protein
VSKARPYRCAHCGEECGPTGHLRRLSRDLLGMPTSGVCPSVGAVPITLGGEVAMAYSCAPGHTCLTASPLRLAFGRSTMTAPIERRRSRDGRPTPKQEAYLDHLGYRGPRPTTKAQASVLIDRILSGEDAEAVADAVNNALRSRGIRVRLD